VAGYLRISIKSATLKRTLQQSNLATTIPEFESLVWLFIGPLSFSAFQ
jgi:hypothetical protein